MRQHRKSIKIMKLKTEILVKTPKQNVLSCLGLIIIENTNGYRKVQIFKLEINS